MKEQLEKLASEFPERFSIVRDSRLYYSRTGDPAEPRFIFITALDRRITWQEEAILHRCLVDLVEEAGLKLYVDPNGWWLDDPEKTHAIKYANSPIDAILDPDVTPELKRRLEEAHAD